MMPLFNILTALFYLLSILAYLFEMIFSEKRMGSAGLLLITAAACVQTGVLIAHLAGNGYPYLLSERDFYYLAAWAIVPLFLFFNRYSKLSGAGIFFAPLALLVFLLAEFYGGTYPFGGAAIHTPWALVHLFFMSLAFAVFTVSFLVGVLYLIQQFQIKSRHPGRFLKRLPALQVIDGIHYKALTVGFALLSIGILSGAALSKANRGVFFSNDPRQLASFVTWGMYALFLNVHLRPTWRGRKGILLSLLGFIGVVLTFLALNHRVSY